MRLSLKTEPVARSLGLMSPPQVGELEFREMEDYEGASAPWDRLATPIGRGPFGHRKRYLSTPSFVLYGETFDSQSSFRPRQRSDRRRSFATRPSIALSPSYATPAHRR
jgi:hypothetical protein